tara:strand:- start:58 stop:552 length:495 start_codon:yes stop_codon:yes gene_type:complete
MPIIQLNFPNPLNVSVQVGDTAYFINPTDVSVAENWESTTTPHKTGPQSGIIKIGEIVKLDAGGYNSVGQMIGGYIRCDMPQILFNQYFDQIVICVTCDEYSPAECEPSPPGCTGSFIMFSKDNKANMSSLLGYYANAQFRNNSTDKAELFNVGTEVFESSGNQ